MYSMGGDAGAWGGMSPGGGKSHGGSAGGGDATAPDRGVRPLGDGASGCVDGSCWVTGAGAGEGGGNGRGGDGTGGGRGAGAGGGGALLGGRGRGGGSCFREACPWRNMSISAEVKSGTAVW